jgi:hypothetical protein
MRLRRQPRLTNRDGLYVLRRSMKQILRRPLRNHTQVEKRSSETYWIGQDVSRLIDAEARGWDDDKLIRAIDCMIKASYARIDKARSSPGVYRKAERDARRRILQGANTSATNDWVLFGYSRNYVVDPALLALTARPLPAELVGTSVSHHSLVQSPRWVYDIIVSAIEESNWADSKHLYTPCVPLLESDQLQLFKHMLEMMELDRAYEATHVLL